MNSVGVFSEEYSIHTTGNSTSTTQKSSMMRSTQRTMTVPTVSRFSERMCNPAYTKSAAPLTPGRNTPINESVSSKASIRSPEKCG